MNTSHYEIRVEGPLGERWSAWFAGLTVSREADGATLICGELADQAALHGVLARIRDLNLVLISVIRLTDRPDTRASCAGRNCHEA